MGPPGRDLRRGHHHVSPDGLNALSSPLRLLPLTGGHLRRSEERRVGIAAGCFFETRSVKGSHNCVGQEKFAAAAVADAVHRNWWALSATIDENPIVGVSALRT